MKRIALLVVALVVGVGASAAAYAAGSSGTHTRVVVKDVVVTTTTKPPPTCIRGAAAGSCNTDEAAEALIPDKPLTAAQRTLVAQQLVEARAAAMKYPTVADARKAGMLQAGQFSPETGAHFINVQSYMSRGFDASNPGSYIYDGVDPTSKVIGVMYLSSDVLPPEGFAGPNDHWHRHTNTCVIYSGGQINVPFPADSDVTQAMCDAKHGVFMRTTVWMVHAWVVPGWESPAGVWSHNNTDVVCADGTTHADAQGFCKGTA